MKKTLKIGENFFEEKIHGDYCFPFEISYDTLSAFEHGFLDCHWHPELEFSVILDGAMEYQVNDTIYEATKGCGIFTNANSLHTARACEGQDCTYIAFIFSPVLIFGHENSAVEKRYVDIIVGSPKFSSLYLDPSCGWQKQVIQLLLDINTLYQDQEICYELLIKSKLCELWSILYKGFQSMLQNTTISASKDISRLKQMLNYIHNNYNEKLTLDNIAFACNISKSECCRFFKKMIRQTPFEYLLSYRIQKSIPLLLDETLNITEIAERVGFANASYYSEIFRRYMSCSPTEYKKLR